MTTNNSNIGSKLFSVAQLDVSAGLVEDALSGWEEALLLRSLATFASASIELLSGFSTTLRMPSIHNSRTPPTMTTNSSIQQEIFSAVTSAPRAALGLWSGSVFSDVFGTVADVISQATVFHAVRSQLEDTNDND